MILCRYICREIYLLLLLILFVLIFVVMINQFSVFLNKVAEGRYSMAVALQLVLFQLPLVITYLLPLGLFLAILLGLGRLYSDHEMTVMSACGMSLLRQTLIVMSLSIIVAIFVGWLSLWVNPKVNIAIKNSQLAFASHFQLTTLVPNRFENLGDHQVVYVKKVQHASSAVKNIFMAINKNKSGTPQWDIIQAQQAMPLKQPGAHRFIVIQNGLRYTVSPGNLAVKVAAFKEYGIAMDSPALIGSAARSAHLMTPKKLDPLLPTSVLYALLRQGDLIAAAEFQRRIAIPVSIIVLSLIAVGLAEINPRRGRYSNLIPAIAIYLLYACIIYLSSSWIQHGYLPIEFGIWWIHGVILCLALVIFCYRMGWRRLCK